MCFKLKVRFGEFENKKDIVTFTEFKNQYTDSKAVFSS